MYIDTTEKNFIKETASPVKLKSIELPDVAIPAAPVAEAPAIAVDQGVIYNKHNLESILTAAIIKTRHPQITVIESGANMPICHTYIWLNIEPSILHLTPDQQRVVASGKHTVFFTEFGTMNVTFPLGKARFSEPREIQGVNQEDAIEESHYVPEKFGMLERALTHFGISTLPYLGLTSVARRFYNKNADLQTLTFVYLNVEEATRVLKGEASEFHIVAMATGNEALLMKQMQSYLGAVRDMRKELQDHTVRTVYDGKKALNAIVTCVRDRFWLAQRQIGFTYKYYVNIHMTLGGAQVHTNVKSTKNLDLLKAITTGR